MSVLEFSLGGGKTEGAPSVGVDLGGGSGLLLLLSNWGSEDCIFLAGGGFNGDEVNGDDGLFTCWFACTKF